jgi:hypothetical protein
MTESNTSDLDQAIRERIFARVKERNRKLIVRLEGVAIDLNHNRHYAALGGLDRMEQDIDEMRCFLRIA